MINRRIPVGAALVLTILVTLAIPAWADGPSAVAWLKGQQNADGGFGSPDSSVGATADTLVAVAATGDNAAGWTAGGPSALDYLKANVGSISKAGDLGKVVLALTASGQNPRTCCGTDLVAQLEGMIGADGKIGGENDFINEHSVAMIALSSASRPVPAASVSYLLSQQIEDGSWSWNGDTTAGSGDNNTTAMVVVALAAAGVPADNAQIQKAIAKLHEQQNGDGGFPYVSPSPWGTDSDANSTAVVIWALLAVGEDPGGVDWKVQGQDGLSAMDKLRAFQNDSGAFRWQDAMPSDNFLATIQAVVAIEWNSLPFARMDVGEDTEGQASTDEGTAAETTPEAAPEALPETGGNLWTPVFTLLGSGVTLTGIGLALRRRR
jgi:hypothetical protein